MSGAVRRLQKTNFAYFQHKLTSIKEMMIFAEPMELERRQHAQCKRLG
jgi:hypothetical protein